MNERQPENNPRGVDWAGGAFIVSFIGIIILKNCWEIIPEVSPDIPRRILFATLVTSFIVSLFALIYYLIDLSKTK